MKHSLLALLFSLSLPLLASAQDAPALYRSIETGYGEHLVFEGNIWSDMTVTRIRAGHVIWSTSLSARPHYVMAEYVADVDLNLIFIYEGVWETTIIMDDFGYIKGLRVRSRPGLVDEDEQACGE